MGSLLFNVGLFLFCSLSVVQFCSLSFSQYARYTSIICKWWGNRNALADVDSPSTFFHASSEFKRAALRIRGVCFYILDICSVFDCVFEVQAVRFQASKEVSCIDEQAETINLGLALIKIRKKRECNKIQKRKSGATLDAQATILIGNFVIDFAWILRAKAAIESHRRKQVNENTPQPEAHHSTTQLWHQSVLTWL